MRPTTKPTAIAHSVAILLSGFASAINASPRRDYCKQAAQRYADKHVGVGTVSGALHSSTKWDKIYKQQYNKCIRRADLGNLHSSLSKVSS
jgi:hypothetical protein